MLASGQGIHETTGSRRRHGKAAGGARKIRHQGDQGPGGSGTRRIETRRIRDQEDQGPGLVREAWKGDTPQRGVGQRTTCE